MAHRFTFEDAEQENIYRQLKRGNLSGLIGMFLTVLYAVLIIAQANSSFVYILAMPHTLCVIAAAIFSIVGYYALKPWALLTAGILLALSAVLLPSQAKMVLVQMILLIFSYIRKVT